MKNNDFIVALQHTISNENNNVFNELYNDMSKYQKQIFDNMRTNPNALENYSLSDLIFDFDKEFIQSILSLEIDLYLKECNKKGIYNKKNGSNKDINLKTSNRTICFNRPRLKHESDFDSQLIPKRTRVLNDLSDNILLLYSKNNSVNDIKDIISSTFNIDISTGLISNIANSIQEQVLAWRNRELKKCYFALNIDCMYISLRDKKYLCSHRLAVYIAVGTN